MKHYLLTLITLLSYYIIYSMLKYNQDGLLPGKLSGGTLLSPRPLCPCLISAKDHILSHFPFLANMWYLQVEKNGGDSPEKRKCKGTSSGDPKHCTALSEDASN